MPKTAPVGVESREMSLASEILKLKRQDGLAAFIARRRHPGPEWASWPEIAYALVKYLNTVTTAEGVRRWAQRYGIPLNTQRNDGPELTQTYRNVCAGLGIELPAPVAR